MKRSWFTTCMPGVVLVAALGTNSAASFESWEHKRLGDLAYHVAHVTSCNQDAFKKTALCTDAERFFHDPLSTPSRSTAWFESPPGKLTYGDVVMCVDFHLSPDKLLAFVGGKADSGMDVMPSSPSNWGLYGPRDCRDTIANLRGNQASHVNHNHFQRDLMSTLRIYHLLGIGLVRDDGNLFGGLAANAISDHYLNDFFAPGHQVTPRALLTDLFANSMHDNVNRTGLNLHFTSDGGKSVARVRLCELAIANGSSCSGAKLALDDAAYFYLVHGCDSSEDSSCRCESDSWQACVTNEHRNLVLEAFADLTNNEQDGIRVVGDGQLWRGKVQFADDRFKQALKQRLVMLAYQVASIRDVMEASVQDRNRTRDANSLRTAGWSISRDAENATVRQIDASLPGIAYRINLRGLEMKAATEYIASTDSRQATSSPRPSMPSRDSLGLFASYAPVAGISFSRDAMLFGDNLGRKVLSLETVPLGFLSYERDSKNLGIAVGYHRFWEGKVEGFGWGVRPTIVLPETETMLGLSVRRLKHPDSTSAGKWRNSLALRIDQGFTSFLTFFLQMGPDYATQPDGRVGAGWSFSAGVQLAAPVTRIPIVKRFWTEE